MKAAAVLCIASAFTTSCLCANADPNGSSAAPYAVTGTIATNRIGSVQSAFLRSATHVSGADTGPETELPPGIAPILAAVLLSDRTWAGEPGLYKRVSQPEPFHPAVSFTIDRGRLGTIPRIDISIDPVSQQMHTMAWGFNVAHGYEQFTSYALAAPQITALLKKAFPQDAAIQALAINRTAVPAAPKEILPDARAKIAALHTGMTRADLLRLFTTEGGLSNRFQRTYVYRVLSVPERIDTEIIAGGAVVHKPLVIGQLVKIDAQFMPRASHLKWIDGAGVLIDPEELYHFDGFEERPDDVLVRLSLPYLGFPIDN